MTENKTPEVSDIEKLVAFVIENTKQQERARYAELLKQCETMAAALGFVAHECMNNESCPSREHMIAKAREALSQWEEFNKSEL
jgi:hypothetical protein